MSVVLFFALFLSLVLNDLQYVHLLSIDSQTCSGGFKNSRKLSFMLFVVVSLQLGSII